MVKEGGGWGGRERSERVWRGKAWWWRCNEGTGAGCTRVESLMGAWEATAYKHESGGQGIEGAAGQEWGTAGGSMDGVRRWGQGAGEGTGRRGAWEAPPSASLTVAGCPAPTREGCPGAALCSPTGRRPVWRGRGTHLHL